ncbi:hypothetical protein [Actinoalloteichus sp. AHMU CJ021]|uniref:hypothetical protein n=1 Tax=Actinoalloteichus sp. AHMU CJ021 TaxID=2072503 RepID=UPI00307C8C8C
MDGFVLYLLGRRLMKLGEDAIPEGGFHGLPASARAILFDVIEHPGSSIGDITERTGFLQSQVSGAVARFRAEGVTIAHSRFLACDRAEIDRGLLRRFGPPESAPDRPPLHIVVASQVVEQSLDVDFDLMVTDLAPVDLLLQRMGRLHRHTRSRPTAVSSPRCAIVGVEDWAAEPARAHPGSRRVYGEHLLLRAAALVIDRDERGCPPSRFRNSAYSS